MGEPRKHAHLTEEELSEFREIFNLVDVVAQVTQEAFSAGEAVPFIWLDVIAINQHCPGDIALCLDRLDRPIKHSGKLLLVLDPWRKPASLSRVWCLLEIMKGIKLGAKIVMRMPQAAQQEFFRAVTNNHSEVEALLTSSRVEDAQATVETDKWAIFAQIQRQLGSLPACDISGSILLKTWNSYFCAHTSMH